MGQGDVVSLLTSWIRQTEGQGGRIGLMIYDCRLMIEGQRKVEPRLNTLRSGSGTPLSF